MNLQYEKHAITNVIHVIIVFASLYVCPIVATWVKIYPDVPELIIKTDSTLTLKCISDEPVQWSNPKGSRNFTKKTESQISNGTYHNILTIDPIYFSDTGYFICRSKNDSSNAAQIYIYCSDEKNPLLKTTSRVDAAMYDVAEIPCKPTSPYINVSLTRYGMEVEPVIKYDPRIGYKISTYPMIDFALFNCFASGYKEKLRITLNVHAPLNDSSNPHIEVTDTDLNYPIFEKQNVTFNCSIITSINMGIKFMEWNFPKHVEKKIIIGNQTEIRHKKFNSFFRILTIYNVTKNDRGNYNCKVIDDYSNTKISNHSLQIEDLNSIFLQVNVSEKTNSIITRAGENPVKFIASVNSFPKHHSTWYDARGKKLGNSNMPDGKYDIINYGSEIELRIHQVEIKNSGIYRLEVRNSWIIKTLNFTLIVEDKPGSITLKKVLGLHNLNFTYSPECTVTGYPLPQIRWSVMNCNNYPNCEDQTFHYLPNSLHKEETVELYEVKSTLHFKPNQSMEIQCQANNSLGSINTSSSFLIFEYSIGIAMRKNHKEPVTYGDNIEFVCVVSKYAYLNDFIWLFEKKEIIPSEEVRINNSATDFSYVSTLSIANIQKNHSGRYTCQTPLRNSSFKSMYSLRNISFSNLNIKDAVKPSVVQSNMNSGGLHVVPGTSVKILIRINGNPLPLAVWYKNGKPLSFNDRITLKTYGDSNLDLNLNLTIGNVSREDEGEYSFVATNKAGNVSDKLQLLIQDSGTHVENTNLDDVLKISIFVSILLSGGVFWYVRNLRKEKKKLQKLLKEYGLEASKENAVPILDANLDIEDQTFLIPYNKKHEFPREKLEFGNVLGSGAFGIVKKAVALGITEEDVKTTVAVKIAKRSHDSLFVKYLVSELKIMIYLGQHPNVINLLGACTKDLVKGELIVIVEYCKYGNLRDFLLKHRNNFVSQITENDKIDFKKKSITSYENIPTLLERTGIRNESKSSLTLNEEAPIGSDGYLVNNELYKPEWRSKLLADYNDDVIIEPIKTVDLIIWSFQAARGMEYLASRKILHGDLAARNILLTEGNIVKISDFGLAKSMYQSELYQSSKTIFPVKWMAIESIRDRVFSTQSDVWSYGITIWELFSLGISPYPGLEHATNLYEKLVAGYRLEKPKFATNQIYSLMTECWQHCPKSRPTFTELCAKLASLLNESTRSQYIELETTNAADISINVYEEENYLQILNSPSCCDLNKDQVHQDVYTCISPKSIDNPTYLEIIEMPEKSTNYSNS